VVVCQRKLEGRRKDPCTLLQLELQSG